MDLFGSKKKVKVKVEGMTCNHCVMRVTKALENLNGVKSTKVSLENKEAEIIFKGPALDPDTIIKAVEDAGYKAKTQ